MKETDRVLEKLCLWTKQRGYEVKFGRLFNDEINFETKVITICSRSKPINQVYSLLHELGHLIIWRNEDKYKVRFPNSSKAANDARFAKSKVYYMEEVHEEIEAWKEGERLAKVMVPDFNIENYNKYAAKWVYGYMKKIVEEVEKKKPVKKNQVSSDEEHSVTAVTVPAPVVIPVT